MNRPLIILVLTLVCAASAVISLFVGGTDLSMGEVLAELLPSSAGGVSHSLIWELRIPRIFTAGVVGSALAVCGVVFQAILRNPLAEPFTLGVSGGGALGATLAILLGIGGVPMALMCFTGCCLSVAIVLGTASLRSFTNSMLILSGVIMSFIFSSAVTFIFAVASSREVHASVLWLMGSLNAPPEGTVGVLALVVPVMLLLLLFSKDLNLLSLGDETTYHLGLNARRSKAVLLITASLITGACVAVSGIIAFIGLMIPHFSRKLVGADHFYLLPASMLSGAGFLIVSDCISQVIVRPLELPVGVITGIAGGVFFVAYLISARPSEVV